MHPAPKSRVPKGEVVTSPQTSAAVGEEGLIDIVGEQGAVTEETNNDFGNANSKIVVPEHGTSPNAKSFMRRTSSVTGSSDRDAANKRANGLEKFKHLGPSNLASRPRQTRYNTVKIKPGSGLLGEVAVQAKEAEDTPRTQSFSAAPPGGVGAGLITSAGKDAKDGVLAVHASYGTMDRTPPKTPEQRPTSSKGVQANQDGPVGQGSPEAGRPGSSKRPAPGRAQSHSTIGSLPGRSSSESPSQKKISARSGSITENIVDAGGFKKVVLETTSSSDDIEAQANGVEGDNGVGDGNENETNKPGEGAATTGKKKRRRRRRRGGKAPEAAPLIEDGDS